MQCVLFSFLPLKHYFELNSQPQELYCTYSRSLPFEYNPFGRLNIPAHKILGYCHINRMSFPLVKSKTTNADKKSFTSGQGSSSSSSHLQLHPPFSTHSPPFSAHSPPFSAHSGRHDGSILSASHGGPPFSDPFSALQDFRFGPGGGLHNRGKDDIEISLKEEFLKNLQGQCHEIRFAKIFGKNVCPHTVVVD